MSREESVDASEARLDWRGSERTEQITILDGGTILDAAENAGIGLPFGCRTGACGTCTARLLEGDIAYKRPPRALKQRHRKQGYILTCIAQPSTDLHLEVGGDVHGDLVENPWK
jgi:ferredoxin